MRGQQGLPRQHRGFDYKTQGSLNNPQTLGRSWVPGRRPDYRGAQGPTDSAQVAQGERPGRESGHGSSLCLGSSFSGIFQLKGLGCSL